MYESEEHEDGSGSGANTTLLSDTLQSIGLAESVAARAKIWLQQKMMSMMSRFFPLQVRTLFFFLSPLLISHTSCSLLGKATLSNSHR